MDLLVTASGQVRCLYHELIDLPALGKLKISRASHVEPTKGGDWFADLSPVGGPVLQPFSCRSQALAAEADWLMTHRVLLVV